MLDHLIHALREHDIKLLTTGAIAVVAWSLGNRRARARWIRRDFEDRLIRILF